MRVLSVIHYNYVVEIGILKKIGDEMKYSKKGWDIVADLTL